MRKAARMFWIAVASLGALGASVPQEPLVSPPAEDARPPPQHQEQAPVDAHFHRMPEESLLEFLSDPENRVSRLFKTPAELRAEVGFWFKIYAKYSLYQTLVYDRDEPGKIYAVIDGRDLFRKGKTAAGIEVTVKLRLKKYLAELRDALRALARNPKARFARETAGARALELWGRRSAKEWRTIRERVRAQPGQRDRVMQGIAEADPFIPAMEAIFRKYALPAELVRIPLVESSFHVKAVSKADAVGVWQFLEKSAQEYLVVDKKNRIDERLSPIKSTYAAARMFQRNYRLLGDYGLAIIAYNHGPKNLMKIRKKYSGENIVQLLKKRKNSPLGYASRNYYSEFLALLHAERYRDVFYGMPIPKTGELPPISIVRMKRAGSVFEIAALYNISLYELRKYNPDIFDLERQLPAGTRVVVPRTLSESLVRHAPAGDRAPAADSPAAFLEPLETLWPPIPPTLKLVELPLAATGDHQPLTRLFGDPRTGRIWEVESRGSGKVIGFFTRKPWKTKAKRALFQELRNTPPQSPSPALERKGGRK